MPLIIKGREIQDGQDLEEALGPEKWNEFVHELAVLVTEYQDQKMREGHHA